jgi:hypothetical protein
MLGVANRTIMLSFIMLNVINAEFHYDECHYAKCHYVECRYAECHGAGADVGALAVYLLFSHYSSIKLIIVFLNSPA